MKRLIAMTLGIALAGIGTVALASRNSGGTYSLAAGNPVTTATTISSTWANNTLGDIAQGLTDSLDRNGKGGMLAPLRTPDGTVAAPTHAFTSETGSGLYRIGAADIGLSVNGTKRTEWTSTGESVQGTLACTGNANVGGTLGVTGAVTLTVPLATAYTDGVATATASRLVTRDGAGRAAFADPSGGGDAATKSYVDARFVVAGRVKGSDGSILAQTGTVTASCVRNGVGNYTVTVAGLTANGIVIASGNNIAGAATYLSGITTNQFTVATATTSTLTAADDDFSFEVLKL